MNWAQVLHIYPVVGTIWVLKCSWAHRIPVLVRISLLRPRDVRIGMSLISKETDRDETLLRDQGR